MVVAKKNLYPRFANIVFLVIIQSCYFDHEINKPFTCANMMRFEGSNGKVCKMMTSHFITLLVGCGKGSSNDSVFQFWLGEPLELNELTLRWSGLISFGV